MTEQPPVNPSAPPDSPEAERRYHRYVGNRIPWFVHLIWVSFWILAVVYVLRYLVPAIRKEIPAERPPAVRDVR